MLQQIWNCSALLLWVINHWYSRQYWTSSSSRLSSHPNPCTRSENRSLMLGQQVVKIIRLAFISYTSVILLFAKEKTTTDSSQKTNRKSVLHLKIHFAPRLIPLLSTHTRNFPLIPDNPIEKIIVRKNCFSLSGNITYCPAPYWR